MDSFYASVEQQYNPQYRGKPVVVLGHGKGTFIIAASKEAKKQYGIKVGWKIYEAKKICPHIKVAQANIAFYSKISDSIYEIFTQFTPFIERYSIDECFLDFSHTYQQNDMLQVARAIKHAIAHKVGEHITCSIGIADNKLMAKVGSDLVKPNGILCIPPSRYVAILDTLSLNEMWGIGHAIEKRLANLGVYSFAQLRQTPLETLHLHFKESLGSTLYQMARGQDSSPVIHEYVLPKSVGHNHSLQETIYTVEHGKHCLREVCEEVAYRLRRRQMKAKRIILYIKNAEYQTFHKKHTLGEYTWDGEKIYKAVNPILTKNILPITFFGIVCTNLAPSANTPTSLFIEERKKEAILNLIDAINKKYRKRILKPYCI